MKNKSRLELLQTREQLLDEVFEAARGKITGIQNDKAKYKELLKGLILQVRSYPCCSLTRLTPSFLRSGSLHSHGARRNDCLPKSRRQDCQRS